MKALSRIYVGLIFFLLYVPILVLIIFSFNEGGSLASFTGVSLKWYRELFADEEALTSLRNSVVLAVSAALIATVIGTFGALGLNTMRKRWLRGAVQTVTNIPMMNPDIVTGVSMMLLFVAAATILGTSNTFGFGTLLIAHVTFDLPYVILSVMPRFKTLDSSLSEAAQDLGCNVWHILFRVLVPLTGPGIATGITQVFVPAVSTFIISRMLGGGSNLLIGDLIELQFLGNSYNLNLGSAMSLVLMVIVLLCMSFTSSFDESEMEGVM